MAKMKKQEEMVLLERDYVIPLRRKWLKVPEYKRGNKAIKAIREFIVRHMKIRDRDLKKVKIDKYLNQEIRFRGIRKPPAKIRVKAKKYTDSVIVELAEIPEKIKWQIEREKRKQEKKESKKKEEKAEERLEEKLEGEKAEEKIEEKKEKIEAVKEAGLKEAEKVAKERKHEITGKKVQIQRKALKK